MTYHTGGREVSKDIQFATALRFSPSTFFLIEPTSPALAGGFFTTESESESEVAQSCLTLSDPMDYNSPPGSSVHGIFQARVLEWGAIAFSVNSG